MKQNIRNQFKKLEDLKKRNAALVGKFTKSVHADSDEQMFQTFAEVIEESLAIQKEMIAVVENIKNLLEQEEGHAS